MSLSLSVFLWLQTGRSLRSTCLQGKVQRPHQCAKRQRQLSLLQQRRRCLRVASCYVWVLLALAGAVMSPLLDVNLADGTTLNPLEWTFFLSLPIAAPPPRPQPSSSARAGQEEEALLLPPPPASLHCMTECRFASCSRTASGLTLASIAFTVND